jgi:hypothetical protein
MEYQKSTRHATTQRPDIILHVPVEHSSDGVTANNSAVWALKRKATAAGAMDDFNKLDEMFQNLHYPLGIFINLEADHHFTGEYTGRYPDRLVGVAVRYDGTSVRLYESGGWPPHH